MVDWIEGMLVHGEGDAYGEPFRLRDDQLLVVYRWFEYEGIDCDCAQALCRHFVRWRYDELFLECATGYGKTELVAALALAELCGPLAPDTPNVPVAAASWNQADELLGRARQMVKHPNCRLKPFVDALDTEIQLKDRPGSVRRVAAVDGTNEGGVPSLFLGDELHEWTGRKARLYIVVRKSLRKRSVGRIITLSTPGSDIDTLAGELHKRGISGADERLLHVWITCDENLLEEINKPDPDAVDPEVLDKALRQANPWKDEEALQALKRDFRTMPRHEFCRYHLAKWVRVPKESWLSDNLRAWFDCVGLAVPEPGRGPIALAWDMSHNRDTTAVAAVQKRDDGRVVVDVRIFTPDQFEGHRIDRATIKAYVRQQFAQLQPMGCAYDPRFLETDAQELEDEGLPMMEFPQSPERMSPACALTYDLIVNGRLEHPNDPVLDAHVLTAVKRDTERGWSLSKRLSSEAIDGCIAMVMGVHSVMTQEPEGVAHLW